MGNMPFEIPSESRVFLELAAKALKHKLNASEREEFKKLMDEHEDMRQLFYELEQDVTEEGRDELWERGLRVLLRVARPGDVQFLEHLRGLDPKGWRDFLQAAFILRVVAKSSKTPMPASASSKLSASQEAELFSAVNKAQEERAKRKAAMKRIGSSK
jgi:hypothetical protein